jgi:hypothetical protein
LHPWQPAEANVELGQDEHHRKRGADERERDQCRPSPRARTQPRYIASCGARGPGASCAKARPSL